MPPRKPVVTGLPCAVPVARHRTPFAKRQAIVFAIKRFAPSCCTLWDLQGARVCMHGRLLSCCVFILAGLNAQAGVPEAGARWLFQQILVAVDFCHRLGIALRDIKVRGVAAPSVSMPG